MGLIRGLKDVSGAGWAAKAVGRVEVRIKLQREEEKISGGDRDAVTYRVIQLWVKGPKCRSGEGRGVEVGRVEPERGDATIDAERRKWQR